MNEPRRVLVVDDDPDFLCLMRKKLRGMFGVTTTDSIESAIKMLGELEVDLVLLDVDLGEDDGLEGISRIRAVYPNTQIAMLSGERDVDIVVKAVRAGALDYLTKPVSLYQIEEVVEKAIAKRTVHEKCDALIQAQQNINAKNIIHQSKPMKDLMYQAGQLKGFAANILIIGETGSGKELIAKFINRNEGRASRPFIAVNCAAIPEHLLEAELFGHEIGSFTGASKRRIGKFELADGGDIFLDEISTMPIDLQVKLLRVLQEKEFCRLGSNTPIKANFRVLSACNQSLQEMVEKNDFRIDLYHRLRVIELNIPSLKSRIDDIPLLTQHFIKKHMKGKTTKTLTDRAVARLMEYSWPGNVRELENVIQSLLIVSPTETIDTLNFPPWIMNGCDPNGSCIVNDQSFTNYTAQHNDDDNVFKITIKADSFKDCSQLAEKAFIEKALEINKFDKTKTAATLGIGRSTLYWKMKDLGI